MLKIADATTPARLALMSFATPVEQHAARAAIVTDAIVFTT
jgi:hypothetical protein